MKPSFSRLLATAAILSLAIPALHAQNGTWTATTDGNWSGTGNWLIGTVANGAGNTANISANIGSNRIVSIDIPVTLGTLNLGDSNDTHAYTIQLSGGSLAFDSGVGTGAFLNYYATSRGDTISANFNVADASGLTINNASGRDQLISGGIAGSKLTLDSAGSGMVTLSGTNTFIGGVAIKRGTLGISANISALGSGTVILGDTSGSANATLSGAVAFNTYGAVPNPITVAGGNTGVATITSTVAVGGTQFSGAVSLLNHDLLLATSGNLGNASLTLSGGITGTGNLILAQGNTGSGGSITLSTNTVNMTGTITNQGTTTGNVSANISATIGANVQKLIQDSAAVPLILGSTNTNFAGDVLVRNGRLNANGANTLGSGTLYLGDDSFANSHTVHFGNGSGALPSNNIILGNRATYTGRIQIGPAAGNSPTYSGGITGNNDLVLTAAASGNNGAFTLSGSLNHTGTLANESVSSGRFTISGIIGANVTGFTQNSVGSATRLSNANTFGGPTTVLAGTLELNHLNALQNSTLDTGLASSQSVALLVAGTYNLGGLQGADDLAIGTNTISVGANGQDTIFAGILSSSGSPVTSLIKTGNGSLTLANANTYTGNTIVNGGTLVVANPGALGSGAVMVNTGGILGIGTGVTWVGAANFNAGSTLVGGGTLKQAASLPLPANFTLAPGSSTGTLTIDLGAGNTLTMSSTTTTEIEIADGNDFDRLDIVGAAILDGNLDIVLLGNYLPPRNTTFDVITASDGLTGNVTLAGPNALLFSAEIVGGDTLRLTSLIPEPTSALLLAIAALAVRRRRT